MIKYPNQLWLVVLVAMITPQLCLADQRITENEQATSKERVTNLQTRDKKLYRLIGTKIGNSTVKSIRYLGTLSVENLEDKEIGLSLTLNESDWIDKELHIADFQLSGPMKNDSIEATVVAKLEDIGKKFVIIFNVNSFGKFDYSKKMRVGEGEFKPHGSASGSRDGVGHIPTSFYIKSSEPVTLKFAPQTDDRWWFYSCDLYIFEEEPDQPTTK